jgi:hypothetical protein
MAREYLYGDGTPASAWAGWPELGAMDEDSAAGSAHLLGLDLYARLIASLFLYLETS